MEAQIETPHPAPAIAPVKLVAGIFFTALGLLLTLDNLGVLDAHTYTRFWPIVLVAIGLIEISRSANRAFGIFLTVVGALLLVARSGWLHVSLFDLWPVLAIAAGLAIISQAVGFGITPTLASSSGSTFVAVLSNRKIVETSQHYRGGRLVAFMGGAHLDLSQAQMEEGDAVIDAFVMWGGIELTVPPGWQVVGEAVPVMAGIDINTQGAPAGRRLVLRGMALMGGIEVKTAAGRNA